MSRFRVASEYDVFDARRGVRHAAVAAGFPPRATMELCIVASELATNILKYGVRGEISVESIHDQARGEGLRIVASDEGSPFADVTQAFKDGHDDRGPLDPAEMAKRRGVGSGLGAVVRFSDDVQVTPRERGKAIVVVRWRGR